MARYDYGMAFREIEWSAPEFRYYEKTGRWYAGVGILVAAVVVAALLQQNFLFAVFAVIAGAVAVVWGRRKPRTVTVRIGNAGIAIEGGKAYTFAQLEGFAFLEGGRHREMGECILRLKGGMNPLVRFAVPAESFADVREAFASSALPEFEYEESFIDYMLHVLRF